LELQLDSACRAFQDDRPLPGTVGPFVRQDSVTRPLARLGQGSFQCIALAGKHVTFRIQGLGFAVQSTGALRQSRNLLANQHFASFPPFRLRDSQLARDLEPDGAPIRLHAGLDLLYGRAPQYNQSFLGRVYRSSESCRRLGRFLNDAALGGCNIIWRRSRRLGNSG